MRRTLGLTGILLSCAFVCAAIAGRGGFAGSGGGGRSQARSAPSVGSGGFRPSGGGESWRSYSAPSSPEWRAPIARPPVETRPAPPAALGGASVLPSMNAGNRAVAPRAAQSIPAQRSARGDDFLGLQSDRSGNRPGNPNLPSPASNTRVANRPFQSVPAAKGPNLSAGRIVLPNPPGRPTRPVQPLLPDRWHPVSNNFNGQFNAWQKANAGGISSFQASRAERWNQIQKRGNDRNWLAQFRSPAYQNWRQDVWDFRRDRGAEVWAATRDMHENLFNDHWWSTCWWRRNAWSIAASVSPWWWWNAATWADTTAFFDSSIGPEPIPYDPGTDVFYDGDSYIRDGQDSGSAADASDQAIALAGPPVEQVPVPEPSPDGQPREWLSLGAWALTQQEQGNPVIFFQMSVNKDGIVAGGYKNALTGDEQPIVGRLDRNTQRLAWHINSTPQTVFETGLSDLTYDVASVFVHFGNTQTQTWLLVRLPSPANPPSTVNIPKNLSP